LQLRLIADLITLIVIDLTVRIISFRSGALQG